MAQMDASKHLWFEENAGYVYLVSIIDDASSRSFAMFHETDSTRVKMLTLKNYIVLKGKPASICADGASRFKANKREAAEDITNANNPTETQIQRTLNGRQTAATSCVASIKRRRRPAEPSSKFAFSSAICENAHETDQAWEDASIRSFNPFGEEGVHEKIARERHAFPQTHFRRSALRRQNSLHLSDD
jgi:hypothetical protein